MNQEPIANVKEIKDIPLDQLDVGMSQVRVRGVSKDIDALARSIERVGLLEPIVVVEVGDEPGRYEILTGQRRFEAHRRLQRETIQAVILDRAVDEAQAMIISLTENVMRLDLTRPELVDAFTDLYLRYGSVKAVVEATGLPRTVVENAVKFDRLIPELKEKVRSGEVQLKAALKAQDAAAAGREAPDQEEALKLAKEMSAMSGVQSDKLRKTRLQQPDSPLEDIIEDAKTGGRITQILVTLSGQLHEALQSYARQEGQTQDDAAAELIERALTEMGFVTT